VPTNTEKKGRVAIAAGGIGRPYATTLPHGSCFFSLIELDCDVQGDQSRRCLCKDPAKHADAIAGQGKPGKPKCIMIKLMDKGNVILGVEHNLTIVA